MISIRLERGDFTDYAALARFHYLTRRPGTVAAVFRAVVRLRSGRRELAGVLVMSYPVARCAERHRAMVPPEVVAGGLGAMLRWANAHVRCISRLIVHPRYRGLGLAGRLIRRAVRECPTAYIEARSQLGRAMPVFERAGMTREPEVSPGRPAYYWARGNAWGRGEVWRLGDQGTTDQK